MEAQRTDDYTQHLQREIEMTLEELIDALRRLQRQGGGGGGGGGGGEPPLLPTSAELKLLRAAQMRVNRRTGQYQEMIEAEEVDPEELLPKLHRLAEREQRIKQITRDIILGKNR